MFNVIIVDDDVNVRVGLKTVIEWEHIGAELVLLAKDGRQVLDYIKNHRVDMIISDVKMPFVDGIELSEYVQKNCPFVHMVLMSAYADFDYCQKAMQFGVTEYIVKPIGRDKLEKIMELIRVKSLEKQKQLQSDRLIYSDELTREIINTIELQDLSAVKRLLQQNEQQLPKTATAFRTFYLFVLNVVYEFCCKSSSVKLADSEVYKRFIDLNLQEQYCDFICKELEVFYARESSGQEKTEKMNVADKAKAFIDENYTLPSMSVSFLAEHCGVSVNYVGPTFKSKFFITINEYIFVKRMEKACEILKNTQETVATIAKSVGYLDVQYFTKLFKKYAGTSPAAYRDQQKPKE